MKNFLIKLQLFVIFVLSAFLLNVTVFAEDSVTSEVALSFEKEVINGLSSDYEYSTAEKTGYKDVWGDTLDVSKLISAKKDVTVYLRKKAYGAVAETATAIKLPMRPVAPSAPTVDGKNAVLKATEGQQYATGAFTWQKVGANGIDISVLTKKTVFQIRNSATASSFASVAKNVTVAAPAAAPKAVYTLKTDSITGVASTAAAPIEYCIVDATVTDTAINLDFTLTSGSIWVKMKDGDKAITRDDINAILEANNITTDAAVNVAVRKQATDTKLASAIKVVNVPAKPANAVKPDMKINFAEEVIEGFGSSYVDKSYEYSITSGSAWVVIPATKVTNGKMSITTLIPANTAKNADGKTIQVRKKAIAKTATVAAVPASEPVIFGLLKRPETPKATDVKFDPLTETVKVISDKMEYTPVKANTPDNYATPGAIVSGGAVVVFDYINVAPSDKYKVRVKATDETFASATLAVNVPARPAKPTSPAYSAAQDALTGVTTAMEYKFDNITSTDGTEVKFDWVKFTSTKLTIDRTLVGDKEVKVQVRVAGTATKMSSSAKEVVVKPVASGPAVSIDYSARTLKGSTVAMQYSTNGGSEWKAIAKAEMSLTSLISASQKVELWVRTKATTTAPASNITKLEIAKGTEKPSDSDVKYVGFTETISATEKMEYAKSATATLAATATWTAVSSGSTSFAAAPEKTAYYYFVRIKATSEAFASEAIPVKVPVRPAYTTLSYDAASDSIRNYSSSYEYKLGSGNWTSDSAITVITREKLGDAAVTVSYRLAATATTPCSDTATISVPAKPAATNSEEIAEFDVQAVDLDEEMAEETEAAEEAVEEQIDLDFSGSGSVEVVEETDEATEVVSEEATEDTTEATSEEDMVETDASSTNAVEAEEESTEANSEESTEAATEEAVAETTEDNAEEVTEEEFIANDFSTQDFEIEMLDLEVLEVPAE